MQSILNVYNITITYNKLTGSFTMQGDAQSPNLNLGPLGPALGWPENADVTFPENTQYSVTSPLPARVSSVTALYIHSDISKSGDAVVDNLYGDEFYGASSIICKVPVTVAPFDNQVFVSNSPENSMFEIQDGLVDSVWFWVTDDTGKELELLFDWSMTLVVQHEKKDKLEPNEMLDILEETRDLVKLAVLSNENILQ